ncbi:hypothetical protein BDB01DRAFT_424931 [Pilobolus umbonatus]|nr:hypothetical protein BDB01DRAFT_424931 [Pilobolus umbonatus]
MVSLPIFSLSILSSSPLSPYLSLSFMSDPSASLLAKRRTREMEDEDEGVTEYGSGIYRYPPYLQPGHFSSLEKLMFFLSSILLIILFIFVGLYARSSQDTDSTLPSPHIPHNKTQYCLTPDCIMTAAQLLQVNRRKKED